LGPLRPRLIGRIVSATPRIAAAGPGLINPVLVQRRVGLPAGSPENALALARKLCGDSHWHDRTPHVEKHGVYADRQGAATAACVLLVSDEQRNSSGHLGSTRARPGDVPSASDLGCCGMVVDSFTSAAH